MYCHFPFLFAYNKCSADEVHNPSGARVEGFGEVDDLHLILDTLSLEQTNEGCRSHFNQQGCLKVCMHVRERKHAQTIQSRGLLAGMMVRPGMSASKIIGMPCAVLRL